MSELVTYLKSLGFNQIGATLGNSAKTCSGGQGTIGHEMAHVIRGHAMKRMVNSTVLQAAARATPVGGWMGKILVQAGSRFLNNVYSQDQELEADTLGARLAAAARFDARGAIRMLHRLQQLSHETLDSSNAIGADLAGYFSTHPAFNIRIANLERIIK